ncbi:MAG: hypothetical protein FWD76_05175, partial [Firmicutes bacterium]|nr:hypothetical protein [Bacillota bacterium]
MAKKDDDKRDDLDDKSQQGDKGTPVAPLDDSVRQKMAEKLNSMKNQKGILPKSDAGDAKD